MIVKERRPTLTGRLPRTVTLLQVLADGTRIYQQTQLGLWWQCRNRLFGKNLLRMR